MAESSAKIEATGRLIFEILRLHGRLIGAGDTLVSSLGLTSARWQLLGTIVGGGCALTVSDIARSLGQSRQSVQRLANELVAEGIVQMTPNPGHRRAPLLSLTPQGAEIYERAEASRLPWTAKLSEALEAYDVDAAAHALAALRSALER
ncbi:MAG TPA: MarR family transcriptional regulator [Aurantimonas coralicida]|uniref:MarR family transcriptional regulator n=1 Tax=Aurantimonas coralicida TaxID=182270 RepID=A0A9C9TI20_9HYPH|nr:MarR family transcriptional regulator [Aurantimonas coralicida]HEU01922.1 MarR family transcriptional regulator [Aurantimonas coralicida]